MEKIEIYQRILERNCDQGHRWGNRPFLYQGKAMATDNIILISLPQSGLPSYPDLSNEIGLGRISLDKGKALPMTVSVEDIRTGLKKLPTVIILEEKITELECPACDGDGEVDFVFYHGRHEYERREECPVCEGDGVSQKIERIPTDRTGFDPLYDAGMMGRAFNPKYLEEVCRISDEIGIPDIRIYKQEERPVLFIIGEIEIILMHKSPGSSGQVIDIIPDIPLLINQGHDNLTKGLGRPEYSPDAREIEQEIHHMTGTSPGQEIPSRLLDEDDLPTEDWLSFIRKFHPDNIPMKQFLEALRTGWAFPEWGFILRRKYRGKRRLELHTGGWSGNEMVIRAIEENPILTQFKMRPLYWKSGGHYYYEILES